MRRFWVKKCRKGHLRSWWRSVVLVTVHRWQRREDGEGRWGSPTKCGIKKHVMVRLAMTVRPAGSSWRSEKWSQYPDSKSWTILKRRPLMDRYAYEGPSHLPSRGMKKAAEEIASSMGRRSPLRSPRRSVVTTTVRRVVRRPRRILADFQQLEFLFN